MLNKNFLRCDSALLFCDVSEFGLIKLRFLALPWILVVDLRKNFDTNVELFNLFLFALN